MKKMIDLILITIIFFIIYFLQISLFTCFNIAGIKPNIFVIFIMIVGLYLKKDYGFFSGIVFGILLDFFIGYRIGINTIAMAITGFASGLLDKNFSKDSRITIMFITAALTMLYEVIVYVFTIIFTGVTNISILPLIRLILLEILYNVLLVVAVYPVLTKLGQKLEEDFEINNSFLNFL